MNEAAAPTFFPFLMLLFFFLFVYFMTIRPQQKRKKEHDALVTALKKGDEVMTSSGIVGKIENVKDRYVLIRLGDNVTINMQKEFISSLLPKGTINNIETQ
ncbi:preprotein translocase subunit YajC [bacterium]|nr:preprotein translocase subunit YajC [bacterium]